MIDVNKVISPKQVDVVLCKPYRHILIDGAVRSGKTFISLLWLIKEVRYQKAKFDSSPRFVNGKRVQPPKIAVIAQSRSTFERNILDILRELVGEHNIDMKGFALKNRFRIMGVDFEFLSAGDSSFIRRVRGGRFTTIYIDELTLMQEVTYNQLLTRCVQSVNIISTTNCDHPSHFVKRMIIDKANDKDSNIKYFHFTLDDNPILTEKEKADFKASIFDKLIYERYVLGKWVAAEGAVYSFDSSLSTVEDVPFRPQFYLIGVDYGVSNPFGATLISCRNPSEPKLPTMIASDEIYYDGRSTHSKKSPSEYVDMIEEKWGYLKDRADVYVDPCASAIVLELRNKGYRVHLAKNDVTAGIHTVANLINNGEFCIHKACSHTLREMHSYRWNEEHALKTGVEKPIKVDDHLPDAIRYCLFTRFGALGYTRLAKRYETNEEHKSELSSYLHNWVKEASSPASSTISESYNPML